MEKGLCLGAPGTMYHIMVQGIERDGYLKMTGIEKTSWISWGMHRYGLSSHERKELDNRVLWQEKYYDKRILH